MNGKPENRVEKIIADLLRGRRLKLRGGDAEEKEAVIAAARLAGARQGPQRMHPAFRKRLAQQQLSLDLERSAKQLLAKEGYDPQFGARPLKRTIQDLLLDPLASKLLTGEFKPGDRIKVVARDGELGFEKQPN